MKTDNIIFVPIRLKPYGIKHELLIQRNRLEAQLKIAEDALTMLDVILHHTESTYIKVDDIKHISRDAFLNIKKAGESF